MTMLALALAPQSLAALHIQMATAPMRRVAALRMNAQANQPQVETGLAEVQVKDATNNISAHDPNYVRRAELEPHAQPSRAVFATAGLTRPQRLPPAAQAIQTNSIPWIDMPGQPGLQFKPLRASRETGAFSCIMRLKAGAAYPDMLHFGATNFFVLSGAHHSHANDMPHRLTPPVQLRCPRPLPTERSRLRWQVSSLTRMVRSTACCMRAPGPTCPPTLASPAR